MNKDGLSNSLESISRRNLLIAMGVAGAASAVHGDHAAARATEFDPVSGEAIAPDEDVFAYIDRAKGRFDLTLYRQLIGAANEFKEGDRAIGVGAVDETTRRNVRSLLSNTR